MVASAVFIMSGNGSAIISRDYRGDVDMSVADRFARHLSEDDDSALKPVFIDEATGVSFCWIRHNGLILMAATKNKNSNVHLVLGFLYAAVEVLESYFTVLNEESCRDNFVVLYELLDEMLDFGFPQSTEARILQEYICVKERHRFVSKPPVAITNAVSWRSESVHHAKNEIFLDVVEKLNLLVASNGTVLRSEILGALKMKSFLSGMPELKLGLNDKLLMEARGRTRGKSVDMEDVRLHQCVRLSRFENDRTISFIPPDGEFTLMEYRLNTTVRPLLWVEAHVEPHSHSRIEYMIKAKSNFKRRSTANNVEIEIPVPADADSPAFKASTGSVRYVPDKDVIIWTIKQFPGQKEFLMRAHFGLPSIAASDEEKQRKPPISVRFELPYFTVSGIQVRYLKIVEKSGYQALPWVRYLTNNGNYQIRMA